MLNCKHVIIVLVQLTKYTKQWPGKVSQLKCLRYLRSAHFTCLSLLSSLSWCVCTHTTQDQTQTKAASDVLHPHVLCAFQRQVHHTVIRVGLDTYGGFIDFLNLKYYIILHKIYNTLQWFWKVPKYTDFGSKVIYTIYYIQDHLRVLRY